MIIVIIFCNIPMLVGATQNCMILSNGCQLRGVKFGDGTLHIGSILFEELNLRNIAWPAYSESAGRLYFEAYVQGKSGIYKANVGNTKKPELFSLGKYPSMSPDGQAIAYFNENNKLVITNILFGTNKLIDGPIALPSIWKRPLWINNDNLVYVTKEDEVHVFSLGKNTHSMLFANKLLPLASKNGLVLFADHGAKKLFKYESGKLTLILKSSFLTMGPAVILFDNGFLYSRQTWSKVLRLSESNSLFYYSFESREEKKLLNDYTLFGGTLTPCM